MPDQEKIQLDKDGFPVPKTANKPTLELDNEGLPIPVKKKEISSDDGTQTLKLSELKPGEQKASPSPSDGLNKITLNQPKKYKGVSLKPIETQFMPKPLSLNEQGYIGNGEKKSNLLSAVDDQFKMHLPQTPQTKDAVANLTKAFSENDIDKIKETRDVILGVQQSKMIKEQEDARRRNFSATPVGSAIPLDIKKDLDIHNQNIAYISKYNIDLTKDVFNNYLRYSITDKHINPPDQAAKDKLKGFEAKPEVSKELYKSIGAELVKNKVPLAHDFTGNTSYDHTRAGIESVMDNLQMEANDLISEGKKTGNATLLNLAKEKAKQIEAHKGVLDNLADQYPDVQSLYTARYLGDVMDEMGIAKFTTTSADVYAAANEIKKRSPEAYKKIEKYISPIAESEGSGLFGQLIPGKVPRSGVGAQVEQSIESFLKEKAGQAISYETAGTPIGTFGQMAGEELRAAGESPLLQGSSKSGAFKSKIILNQDGTFIEKPNENYGVINWNNAVRSITHALPGLAEWITIEKAGGTLIGKALEEIGGILPEAPKFGSIGGARFTEESFEGAAKAPFSQTGGLISASLATGYEPARRLADDLIDDKSGWGDAKKNAFAVFNSMVIAGVFHMLGASPNKILTESLQRTIAKSSMKMLEEANWQNLTEEGVSKVLNEAYPVAARLANAAGQSLKEGAQIAGAGEVSNKINQLSAAIVNPKKADFSITEDDFKGTIGQALTMSLLPAIGRIVSKGGSVPYMAKDAIYDAAIHEGIIVDNIHDKVKSGEYTSDQGTTLVKLIRTYKDSIIEAGLQTTKEGLPLSNKQIRDWATADFRSKMADVFRTEKLSGKDVKVEEGIDAEVNQEKDNIVSKNDFHKVEDSEIFKSISPVAEGAEKPEKYLDIDPNKKYNITVAGEQKVVMGDTLQRILSDPDNYVQAKPEEITAPVELRPEITQGNLTDEDFKRITELNKKQNPVIENGKVVKPGEALSEEEQREYDSIIEKKETGKPYTEQDFRGIRDDDFAKKYLTEKEYQRWHELDRNDDPEAKKIISDKKQELLSQKPIKNENEKADEAKGQQKRDMLSKPEAVTEGAGKKEPAPISEKPTKDDLTPTIVVNGKEYTGDNHAEAMNKAIAAGEDIPSPDTKEGEKFREENGMFKDKDGNLLSRDQTEEKYGIRNSSELLPTKTEKDINLQTKKETDAELEKHLPDTLSPTEKRGSVAGGEANAEATILTGAMHSANEKAKSRGEGLSKSRLKQDEAARLTEYAKENDIWLNPDDFGTPDANGVEQDVYFNEDGTIATKVASNIDPDTTWNDFFHRIAIHNALFPDVAYTLKGFTEHNGEFSAVLEQPFIQGENAKFSEVKEEMGKLGFTPVDEKSTDPEIKYSFINEKTGVVVSDLHGENVIKGTDGKIHFIDPIIELSSDRKEGKVYPNETIENKVSEPAEGEGGTTKESDKNIGTTEEGKGEQKETVIPPPPPPPPLIPPIKTVENTGTPKEEWTAIRKEKQKEIDEVRQAYEQQRPKDWSESMKVGLTKLQGEYPDQSLYDAALKHKDEVLATGYKGQMTTDESLAVLQYLKREIGLQRARLSEDLISDNAQVRENAIVQDMAISRDFVDTALAIKEITTTAGRTLSYAQTELGFDPEYGLQIRRMDLARENQNHSLTDEQLAETARLFEQEKELYQREAEAKMAAMQQKFDNEIAKLTKKNENKEKSVEPTEPKTAKERKEKLLKQSGKDLADKLRAGKIKGTYSDPLLVGQAINTVIDALAFAVEKGATLAQAIKDYIEEHKIKDEKAFTKGVLNHIDREDNRAETLGKIKEIAALNKVEDLHGDMVAKNLIRDYVNSFIGTVEQKDVLQTATDGLKEVLPEIKKERLVEAYLKEGDFKQKSKKELNKGISSATRELKNIAKLEEDIADLKGYKELRQRTFATEKERSDYEKQLQEEKAAILKERREDRDRYQKGYQELESERNRQLKRIEDLKDKRDKLREGIREKTDKKVTVDTPEIENLKKEVAQADKDLRESENAVRKVERDAENKRKKIAELNEAIERLKERGELLKKSKTKTEKEIDDDIKAKQDELKRVMIDKGLKVSNVDKFTKASYETRAQAHNERLNDLSNRVSNMILSDDLSNEQKKALTLLKERLDKSVIKLDPNSALSQERVLQQGIEDIKAAKAEFGRIADLKNKSIGEINHLLQIKIIDKFNKDIDNTKQDILLDRLKKRLANERDEYNRKINAGEFEDNPVTELTKADAELIKIRKERDIIMGQYDKLKEKYKSENQSNYKKAAETLRSLWVAYLIHKGITLGKVAVSAVTRPNLEALTKLTFGKWYERFISPTIAYKAKEGGESQSLLSIQKGYHALFNKYTENGINRRIESSNKEFENTDEAYRTALENLDYIDDKRTKEYKDLLKITKELKSNRDEALVKNVSYQMFGFLSGNPYSESWQILWHRSADIEREFGHFDTDQWSEYGKDAKFKERFGVGIDNLQYLASSFGRMHSALKNFSARQSFASSFVARLEYAVNEVIDVTSADKILEIANESYLDFERGKYQQSNPITDKWNKVIGFVDREVSPVLANLERADVAITRVPVNQLIEAIGEYAAGAVISSVKTGIEYYKGTKKALYEGYNLNDVDQFKEQIKKNVSDNLTAKEAATIVRAFRKGGLGIGLYALGAIGGIGFGGLPHLGQTADDKKIAKRERETGVKELKTGEIKIGDTVLPEGISKIIEHTPALYPMLFGLGFAQVKKNNIKLGQSTPVAVKNDVISHINIILNSIPQYKVVAPLASSFAAKIKPFGTIDDVDKDGNPIKLHPFRVSDYLNMALGQKDKMLSPENFKTAQKIQRGVEAQRASIIDDPNLSESEKDDKLITLQEEYEKAIDNLYASQKH